MIINKYYSDIKRPLFDKRAELLESRTMDIDLIFFGDSILQGFDINRFGGSKKYILNSAIGGDTLDFMTERITNDVFIYKPRKILFMGGINDIRTWYNAERTVLDINEIVQEVVQKYTHIIELCLEHDITVYPCTIILNSEDKNNYPFLNLVINRINTKLINYFDLKKLEYVDLNEVLINSYGFLSRDLTDDGLHPNDYGNFEIYKVLNKMGVL